MGYTGVVHFTQRGDGYGALCRVRILRIVAVQHGTQCDLEVGRIRTTVRCGKDDLVTAVTRVGDVACRQPCSDSWVHYRQMLRSTVR